MFDEEGRARHHLMLQGVCGLEDFNVWNSSKVSIHFVYKLKQNLLIIYVKLYFSRIKL